MTTMNYPANYTAIAADEMVYLNGGTLLTDMKANMDTVSSWIDVFTLPFYAAYYAVRTGINFETGIASASDVGGMLNNLGYTIRYIGLTISSWAGLPSLIG